MKLAVERKQSSPKRVGARMGLTAEPILATNSRFVSKFGIGLLQRKYANRRHADVRTA